MSDQEPKDPYVIDRIVGGLKGMGSIHQLSPEYKEALAKDPEALANFLDGAAKGQQIKLEKNPPQDAKNK